MRYSVPADKLFELHHVRPRFKGDIENVLIYMSTQISKIGRKPVSEFMDELFLAIKLYPGNGSAEDKTIHNWRTEISSLLGLIQYANGDALPSNLSNLLSTNQDLVEFFRYFLLKFQYPGGHVKPEYNLEIIRHGIKFQPTKYILQVLMQLEEITEKRIGLSKAEATHCIFNDLRVTRDGRSPRDTALLILENRENKVEYVTEGDVIRYAGDILDYMDIAELVQLKQDYGYYLNHVNLSSIEAFIQNQDYFHGYDQFYSVEGTTAADIRTVSYQWFDYVNEGLDTGAIEVAISSYAESETRDEVSEFVRLVLEKIRRGEEISGLVTTKEIGDLGESVTIEHEKIRVSRLGLARLVEEIKKIPDRLAVGYDIQSYEEDSTFRYIEVKTTRSKSKIHINTFNLSTHQWNAARSFGERFFVYRILISRDDIELYIIRDPNQQYKDNNIDFTLASDGAVNITYTEKSAVREALLV